MACDELDAIREKDAQRDLDALLQVAEELKPLLEAG